MAGFSPISGKYLGEEKHTHTDIKILVLENESFRPGNSLKSKWGCFIRMTRKNCLSQPILWGFK